MLAACTMDSPTSLKKLCFLIEMLEASTAYHHRLADFGSSLFTNFGQAGGYTLKALHSRSSFLFLLFLLNRFHGSWEKRTVRLSSLCMLHPLLLPLLAKAPDPGPAAVYKGTPYTLCLDH